MLGVSLGAALIAALSLVTAAGVAFTGGSDNSTLIVAATDTPQNLDMQKSVHLPSLEVNTGNLYDPLIEFKKKPAGQGKLECNFSGFDGRLARSWSVSNKGRTWTFSLRRGVKSAAGNELTAADVKWTWDRIWGVKGLGMFYYNTLKMKPRDIKVVSKYVVSFTTRNPAATFLCDMQQFASVVFDSVEAKKHATPSDRWATAWLAKNAAGFGPYEVESWTPGQQMILVARDDYYRGAPKIKRVIYRAVPESSNRLALLLNGTVDVAEDLSGEELAKVRSSKGVRDLYWPRGSRIVGIEMNLKQKPFDNRLVRQAMQYATPYSDIIKTVYKGRARRMLSVFPSAYSYWTSQYNHYNTSLAKAKELLGKAGLPSGFTTTLSYNSAIPEEEQLAILMRTNLAKIGVRVNLQKLPPAVFTQKLQAKEFPFVIYPDQPICPNPGYALFLYYVTGSFVNYTNYSNPRVDALVDQGLATLAPAKQRRIWHQTQRLILNDAPWIWVAEPGFHLGARANVRGATWYPINLIQFRDFSKS
jgi:peptide/nickel transport system substrate-binding protein